MSDKYEALVGIVDVETVTKDEDYVQLKITCASSCIKSMAAAYIIGEAEIVELQGRTYKASRPQWDTEDDTTIILKYTAIN